MFFGEECGAWQQQAAMERLCGLTVVTYEGYDHKRDWVRGSGNDGIQLVSAQWCADVAALSL